MVDANCNAPPAASHSIRRRRASCLGFVQSNDLSGGQDLCEVWRETVAVRSEAGSPYLSSTRRVLLRRFPFFVSFRSRYHRSAGCASLAASEWNSPGNRGISPRRLDAGLLPRGRSRQLRYRAPLRHRSAQRRSSSSSSFPARPPRRRDTHCTSTRSACSAVMGRSGSADYSTRRRR